MGNAVVVVESDDGFGGRAPVPNKIATMIMPMMRMTTTITITVQRVLRHHILRDTRRDVFLNVAA